MKRRLLIIAVFLLLGAVVNVAVAWGLSLRSWPYTKRYGFQQQLVPDEDGINWWRRHVVPGFPDTPAGMHTLHRFGYRSLVLYDNAQKQESFFFAYAEAHGWPMVSLESQHWVKRYATDQYRAILLSGWPLPAGAHPELPILPLWPGFYVNTIVYAGMLWLLVTVTVAARRRRRRRGDLCPACGYPTGESDVCTECGGLLPKRVAT